MLRNKIVYDTQIVSNAAAGIIPAQEWTRVSHYISSKCRYCISLNTLYELLAGLASGDDSHFEENQNRLRFLCPPYRKEFLPLVGDFLRTRVFGKPLRRRDFHPSRLGLWPKIILRAKYRAQLEGGVTLDSPTHKGRRYGFSLAALLRQIQEGKTNHSRVLGELRSGTLRRSSPQIWATAVLHRIELSADSSNIQKLLTALDAAYHYDQSLWELAENQTYDLTRHDSDWIDEQQLFYLADPTVLFVTSDTRIKRRTSKSRQADRILSFEELKILAARFP
jgi:hypothetical protein